MIPILFFNACFHNQIKPSLNIKAPFLFVNFELYHVKLKESFKGVRRLFNELRLAIALEYIFHICCRYDTSLVEMLIKREFLTEST